MNRLLSIVFIVLFLFSCKSKEGSTQNNSNQEAVVTIDTKEVTVVKLDEPGTYQATATRKSDLVHTQLQVSFDWIKQYCFGKAYLQVKPYFYPQNTLELDAKGFELHEVSIIKDGKKTPLKYEYDGWKLNIQLDRTYTRDEMYTIFIDYTAKPAERETGGSAAITSDQGLYFINGDGKDKRKPRQIWTQGETESNSCWFPTIDKPNERMTQEIQITVDSQFISLSNGYLEYSILNGDGTRTDHWRQDLPHAPYLVMMTIGDYHITKDYWREKEVSYYVEHEYAPYAKETWGNTPEMMEFFSNLLGYDYPWDKYSQITAREYVSGAMENTSASLYFENMHQTHREMIDGNYEGIIAHELFHQWFGDLVTCESWSNLPLNESFATYGEYLWDEYKYGRDAGDLTMQGNWNVYMSSARAEIKDLIRFNYENKEDMFDAHSYQKGAAILHMLRKYLGDDAFFAGLNLYLKDNQFTSVEIHDLRLAMEEICGEDLNWFFEQWFLGKGHPSVEFSHSYDAVKGELKLRVKQRSKEKEDVGFFELPLDVDVYVGGKVQRERIRPTTWDESFVIKVSQKPNWVNFDAEKSLLGEKKDIKERDEWIFALKNGKLYMDRFEALAALKSFSDSLSWEARLSALSDPFHGIQSLAISSVYKTGTDFDKRFEAKLLDMVVQSKKSSIREKALRTANDLFTASVSNALLERAMKDSSYSVTKTALEIYAKREPQMAYQKAKSLESDARGALVKTILDVYSKQGTINDAAYFEKALNDAQGYNVIFLLQSYKEFVERLDNKEISKSAVNVLSDLYASSGVSFVQNIIKGNVNGIAGMYRKKKRDAEKSGNTAEANDAKAMLDYIEEIRSTKMN